MPEPLALGLLGLARQHQVAAASGTPSSAGTRPRQRWRARPSLHQAMPWALARRLWRQQLQHLFFVGVAVCPLQMARGAAMQQHHQMLEMV